MYKDFFHSKGHTIHDSMPLVPDDSSLLFTNAGMVQFKDVFIGKIPTPNPPRATSSQLCIRAGGKHNDLENVGYTARHHTLFEMLGNFSFGDYFKKDAIAYAWEFVTQILGFDKSVLYVTIHESDDEAFELWCKYIEPSRIKRMGDKDNFWQMGDTGPCGPCSEIYVDQGAQYFHSSEDYFGGDGDRFLEIWNLVFMQYEQKDGIRTPLPKPSIDTGMGLERVVALLEGELNNFDTSLFRPIIDEIESLVVWGVGYGLQKDRESSSAQRKKQKLYFTDKELLDNNNLSEDKRKARRATQASFRVIADHARSVAFLLAQGANFDREGRGYVLRRILRRAVRHGYLLGLREPFLYQIIAVVCESMGKTYTYLLERKDIIMEQCKEEEKRFFETIESGMSLFHKELDSIRLHKEQLFNGEVAFKLYDTYGFPLDLTQDMLRAHHIKVDMQSFESCMDKQRNRGKASWKGSGDKIQDANFNSLINNFDKNEFVGYETMNESCQINALLDSDFEQVESLERGQEGWVMLDKTPFYPESGGPIGDRGGLFFVKQSHADDNIKDDRRYEKCADVLDTQKFFDFNLSKILPLQTLSVNQKVFAQVDDARLEIAKHHSATHLLHFALREILGTHITQAGSLVESHRLRFDFSHSKALSSEEIESIESLVNAEVCASNPQICEITDIQTAKAKGAIALFGEKYGQNVRVVCFGDSVELCGGIHVQNTAQIGSFYIVKESGVSSGVRRIEAVCGAAAYRYGKSILQELSMARESLRVQNIIQGIEKLKNQLLECKNRAKRAQQSTTSFDFEEINGVRLIVSQFDNAQSNEIKEAVDNAKNVNDKVAILLLTESKGKVTITAGVKNAQLKAGIWVKEVAKVLGGNGGGQDHFATAGGRDVSKISEALAKAREVARREILQN